MTATARRATPYHKGLPVNISHPAWMDAAACRDEDPELWFPLDGNGRLARAICRECPVRVDCLNHAIAVGTRDGIWGGLDMERERPKPRRKR